MTRKDMIRRAIVRNNTTAKICQQPDMPEGLAGEDLRKYLAIFETACLAKGRAQAYDAVFEAMCGNSRPLAVDADCH